MKKLFICLLILSIPTICPAYKMTISWDANKEPDLAKYKLFIGNSSGSYTSIIDTGTTNSYTVNNVTPGLTYYTSVKAIDTSGNESTYSKEVSASIPTDQVILMTPLDGQIVTSRPTLIWAGSGFSKYSLYASLDGKTYQKAYSGSKTSYTIPFATWLFYIKKGKTVYWYVIGTMANGSTVKSAIYSFTRN